MPLALASVISRLPGADSTPGGSWCEEKSRMANPALAFVEKGARADKTAKSG
jgi:hypothetical protein